MNDRSVRGVCLLAMLAGAALQLYFLARGFYSISWDESGRTLDAYAWAWHGVVQGGAWLPFYRIVVGSALQVFPDLVITPRAISGLFGLALIPALGWLASELFKDRRTTLITLAGAALFSQRVALSLAPVSSIMFIFFAISGLALFCRWLRTGGSRPLYACAILIAIAGTERYEGWLFGAAILGAVYIRPPRPNLKRLLTLTLILFTFPAANVVVITSSNPIATIRTDSRQHSTEQVLRKNPLVEFVLTNGLALNLAGLTALVPLIRSGDHRYRYFAGVAFAPLAVLSLGLLVAFAAQTGPSWRLIAVWSMLLLPFTAHSLVRLAQWPSIGSALAVGAAALLLAAFVHHTFWIERESQWAFPEFDRAAGAYIRRAVEARPASKVLIESSEYFYLNVLVASQHPDAFVLGPKPEFERGQDLLILFRTPEHTQSLDLDTSLVRLGRFGPWSLYCIAGTNCPATPK